MGLKESNNRSYSSMCLLVPVVPTFRRRAAPLPARGKFCNRASSAAARNVHLGFQDDFELVVDDKGDGD